MGLGDKSVLGLWVEAYNMGCRDSPLRREQESVWNHNEARVAEISS